MKLGVALFVLGALTVASSLKMIPLRSAVQLPERKTSVNDIWQACGVLFIARFIVEAYMCGVYMT
jgi:hypothetical protein